MSQAFIAKRRGTSRYGVRYHLRNAADKLGVDDMQALRHWPGFPASSALNDQRSDSMDELKLGPLGQVSMLSRDAARTEAWYRDVLRLPHVFTFGDLVFFDCAGTRLYFRQVPDDQWRASSILYFLVPDIQAAHDGLVERGVRFQGAPHMIYSDDATGVEEWMAFFDDPDGNTLAVMARVGGSGTQG